MQKKEKKEKKVVVMLQVKLQPQVCR